MITFPPGFAFLSRRPSYPTEHLHIVISPVIDGKVLLVNLTSKKYDSDDTCILCVGDHEFIKHDSVISYVDAIAADVSLMEKAILSQTFKPQSPISDTVLKKIQDGAQESDAFPDVLLKYIPI
jgi:hypothetical protein